MNSRLLKLALLKEAADLGFQNIPQMFVQGATGYEIKALYWREPTTDNKTIEIWRTQDGSFLVVEGDYSDGEWGQQDVSIAAETSDVRSALNYASSYYNLAQNEEPISEDQEDPLAATNNSRLRKYSR